MPRASGLALWRFFLTYSGFFKLYSYFIGFCLKFISPQDFVLGRFYLS